MKQTLGSAVLGVACFGIVAALISSKAGEGEVWATWLVTTVVVAFLAGYSWPEHPLRGVLIIMLTQPLCLLVAVAAAGEITNPGSSTGGLAGVMIVSTLVLFWTPVPLLLGWLGARARRRPDTTGGDARP